MRARPVNVQICVLLPMPPSSAPKPTVVPPAATIAAAGQFTATALSGPIVGQIIAQQFRSQAAGYAAQFPGAISLIVTQDGTAIGRLLLHCESEHWYIIDIALLPADCGRGAGTKILDALEASARQQGVGALTLSVLADNSAALRFYLRRGFAETGQAGAAHIAMKKDLG